MTSGEPHTPAASAAPDRRRRLSRIGGPLDLVVAIAIAIAYVAILLGTTSDLGYARDEGFYFQASQSYARWFEQLLSNWRAAIQQKAVDAAWSANSEHPGLIKSLFALSNMVLQRRLGLFAMEGTSYRFPAIVLAGAGVALVYFWGTQARGRVAGLAAAVLLAAMPRFFYQGHLACFDVPIVTMWMLCAYCYWRSVRAPQADAGAGDADDAKSAAGGLAWPILCGVTFGLALDTKHNSWFLPIALTTHAALVQVRARLVGAPAKREGRRAVLALACMAVLGPLMLYALWPWIWRDTIPRLRGYALFHLEHEYYNMEFLGRNYWTPPMPRAYAWVMTAATVPTVTLLLALAGLCARARASFVEPLARLYEKARDLARGSKGDEGRPSTSCARAGSSRHDAASTDLLWLLGMCVAYAAWLSPRTPIFGGTKHWMTAYPFLALFAGAGFAEVVSAARLFLARASRRRGSRGRASALRVARGPVPALVLGACVFAAPVVETARSHPWGLSSYTPLVGGASGAATLGLNRTFWGYTTGAVVGYLNREARRNATVYIHDTAWQSWDMFLRDGRIRRDIRGVGSVAGADFGLYHHELHMLGQEYQNWIAFGTAAPDHIAGLDGVPVILVYRRPDARPSPAPSPPPSPSR